MIAGAIIALLGEPLAAIVIACGWALWWILITDWVIGFRANSDLPEGELARRFGQLRAVRRLRSGPGPIHAPLSFWD